MIDRGDIRQAIDRCSNIWASLPGMVVVSSSIELTAWLQNSKKRAEQSEIDVWASHRDYRRSDYLHHRLPVMGCWYCRDNAITYKAVTKSRGHKLANTLMQTYRCVSVMLLRSLQNTRRVKLMLKLKMMLCVLMLPLVVVGCTSKQSVSQCVKPPPPPAWIMQPPRLADTAEQDYFTLQRELITMQKTTGRNPEVY